MFAKAQSTTSLSQQMEHIWPLLAEMVRALNLINQIFNFLVTQISFNYVGRSTFTWVMIFL